jgi:hypothetical protein
MSHITRFLAIVAWLALGHAVLGALFWGLLLVPESTVFMVGLSALIVLLLLVVAAWVEVLALHSFARGRLMGGARIRTIVDAVPAFLGALAIFGIVFALTWLAGNWLGAHRGEMDAWMIVHAKTVRTAWVHATLGWILWVIRFGIGLSLALALLAQMTTSGLGSIKRPAWLGAGLRPLRILFVALAMFAFVWLPWQGVYWRPKALPPTWLEPAFVVTKLLLLYLLANLGWALALRITTGETGRRTRPD